MMHRRGVLASSLALGLSSGSGLAAGRATPARTTVSVTTLAGGGPGSLREALALPFPRRIVFAVAGVIDLGWRNIRVGDPFVTIAGETAPEPGVTLIRGGLIVSTHDVLVRHIRVRPGADGGRFESGREVDGLSTDGGWNIVVEQCSFSWATDENLSASGPRFTGDTVKSWRAGASHGIVFRNNIIAEGLSHATHAKGEHSKGTLIHDNSTDILIVGNLYAHNVDRNPLFKGGARGAVVNNLIYDFGGRCVAYLLNADEWAGRAFVKGRLAIVGNVCRAGPSTRPLMAMMTLDGAGDLDLYMRDNIALHAAGRPALAFRRGPTATGRVDMLDRPPPELAGIRPMAASRVEAFVLANAGARPWARDAIDAQIVQDARTRKGKIIDDEKEVGGYPR